MHLMYVCMDGWMYCTYVSMYLCMYVLYVCIYVGLHVSTSLIV